MSKERLEEARNAWHIDGDITDYHFYWLIEQAERVQELEQENIGLKQDLKNVTEQFGICFRCCMGE